MNKENIAQTIKVVSGKTQKELIVYQVFTSTGTGLYRQMIFYGQEPSLKEIQEAELVLKNGVAIKNRQGPSD